MINDKEHRAEGYRIPKLVVKDLILNVITLGFKRPHTVKEEAKTYQYIFKPEYILIMEEKMNGDKVEVARKVFLSEGEKETILSKGKFKEGAYVYYLDKETIK